MVMISEEEKNKLVRYIEFMGRRVDDLYTSITNEMDSSFRDILKCEYSNSIRLTCTLVRKAEYYGVPITTSILVRNLRVVDFYEDSDGSTGFRLEDDFDNTYILCSDHERDCCESHYLDISGFEKEDFFDVHFDFDIVDLSRSIERVDGSGIRLLPKDDHPIFVPGYSSNNGYYSDNLSLCFYSYELGALGDIDITECQPKHYE